VSGLFRKSSLSSSSESGSRISTLERTCTSSSKDIIVLSLLTTAPLLHVRPKPRGVFEDLLGFFHQRTRHQHIPGTGSQEVRRIEAGCALDQRWDTGVL